MPLLWFSKLPVSQQSGNGPQFSWDGLHPSLCGEWEREQFRVSLDSRFYCCLRFVEKVRQLGNCSFRMQLRPVGSGVETPSAALVNAVIWNAGSLLF